MEQVHRKILLQDRVAGSRVDRSSSKRWFEIFLFPIVFLSKPMMKQIPFSLSFIVNSITATYIRASNPTSMTASIHMRTAASFSITSSVCPFQPVFDVILITLSDSDGPVQLELPEQWLWDIIDEFIYQYQVFCTWRSKITTKTPDELMMLAEGGPVRPQSISFKQYPDKFSGLEFLQRSERSLLSDAKIESERIHRRAERRKVA